MVLAVVLAVFPVGLGMVARVVGCLPPQIQLLGGRWCITLLATGLPLPRTSQMDVREQMEVRDVATAYRTMR